MDSWPFLGVSITLLIIFMLFAGHQPHHSAYADLPLAGFAVPEPKAMRDDAMRVLVARDGSVYFRNTKVAVEDLPELIRQAVRDRAERKIYLAVDARARYEEAGSVLDRIREAEIRDVTILADKRQGH